jgi:hypothetical protein
MGASPGIIERLSNGDITSVFSHLKEQAQAGDASAANQLDYIAHFTCGFAGINGPQSDFQTSELLDSNSLSSADGDWFRAVREDRNAFNQQLVKICQQSLDKSEIDTWVTAAAARGDPASHYSGRSERLTPWHFNPHAANPRCRAYHSPGLLTYCVFLAALRHSPRPFRRRLEFGSIQR